MKLFILLTTLGSVLIFSQSTKRPLIIKNDSTQIEKLPFKNLQDSISVKQDLILVKVPSDSLYSSLVKRTTDVAMIKIRNTTDKPKDPIVKFEDPKPLLKK